MLVKFGGRLLDKAFIEELGTFDYVCIRYSSLEYVGDTPPVSPPDTISSACNQVRNCRNRPQLTQKVSFSLKLEKSTSEAVKRRERSVNEIENKGQGSTEIRKSKTSVNNNHHEQHTIPRSC